MNIILCFNIRHTKPDVHDPQYLLEAEFDEPETISVIKKSLRLLGHTVYLVEANENAYTKFRKLKNKTDIVFNIAEGIYGRDREAQIPAILEMLQIPYTGPRPLGYALGLDKAKAKEIMSFNGVLTPWWVVISCFEQVGALKGSLQYPLIVKPVGEGSSKGIQAKNFIVNFAQLQKVTKELLDTFSQNVLMEEYLPGREFTVAIIGNPPQILPIIEVTFDKLPNDMPKFDHFEAKWIYDNPEEKSDPLICPAVVTTALEEKIKKTALEAFKALDMADWARLDIRLDKKGRPNVIEINCPPGIIPDPKENSRFPRAARVGGLSYESMIEKILRSACVRYGIQYY
ncbi:MAG: D-alanine--D-alanine ligase [bacterium]